MTESGEERPAHENGIDTAHPRGQITPLSLLERARAKDPVAWQRLVELYAPLVRCWCRRGNVHDQDGEDVSQEVFGAAASGLDQFHRDRPGDTFRGWLRGITRNHILLHFRRNKGHPRAEGGCDSMADIPDPLAESDENETQEVGLLYRRALEQVRGEFEEKTWQAFWRTAVENRPPAELTEELSMSAAAIRQAKSRVLRRLKQEVGDLLT